MAHTPGKWKYYRMEPDGHIVTRLNTFVVQTSQRDVAGIVPGGGPIRDEDDARLIAAAPDLLAACAGLLMSADAAWEINPQFLKSGHEWPEACEQARAAIASVTGTDEKESR